MLDLCDSTDNFTKYIKVVSDLPFENNYINESNLPSDILVVAFNNNHSPTFTATHKTIPYEEFITLNSIQDKPTTLVFLTSAKDILSINDTFYSEYIDYTHKAFNTIKKINSILKENNKIKVLFLNDSKSHFAKIFTAAVKCWKQEAPKFWLKAISVNALEDIDLDKILAFELKSNETLTLQDTVDYVDNLRVRPELQKLDYTTDNHCIKSGDVVFVTGGGKGVVAHMVYELCSIIPNLTLVITGRSKPNSTSLELTNNLAKLNKISKLEYIVCDITNHEQLTNTLNKTLQKHKKIDAFIHAAGLSIDSTVDKLNYTDWRLVLDTKILPLLVLHNTINIKQLKILISISSAAALFGNIRQSSYSAANSVLESYTNSLSTKCHSKTLSFSAIEGGMVSDGLRAVMKTLNLTCLSVQSISSSLVDSMNNDFNGQTIEYISNDQFFINKIEAERKERAILNSFKGSKIVLEKNNKLIRIPIKIVLKEHPKLKMHRFFGRIVVPASHILNTIIKVYRVLYPEHSEIIISEYNALSMIVLDENTNKATTLNYILQTNEDTTTINIELDNSKKSSVIIKHPRTENSQLDRHTIENHETEPYYDKCYGSNKIDLGTDYQIIQSVNNLDSLGVSLVTTTKETTLDPCEAALESITQSNALYTTCFYQTPSFPYKIKQLAVKTCISSEKFRVNSILNNYPLIEPLCSTRTFISDSSGNPIGSCKEWINVYNRFIHFDETEYLIKGEAKIDDLNMKTALSRAAGIDPSHYFITHNININCHDILKISLAILLARLGIDNKIELNTHNNTLSGEYSGGFVKAVMFDDTVYVFALSTDFEVISFNPNQTDECHVDMDTRIPVLHGLQYAKSLLNTGTALLNQSSDKQTKIRSLDHWVEIIGEKTTYKAKLYNNLLFAYKV
jgi:NADP-dependent 3-hydroxy acid dehydrogenase YdfG